LGAYITVWKQGAGLKFAIDQLKDRLLDANEAISILRAGLDVMGNQDLFDGTMTGRSNAGQHRGRRAVNSE